MGVVPRVLRKRWMDGLMDVAMNAIYRNDKSHVAWQMPGRPLFWPHNLRKIKQGLVAEFLVRMLASSTYLGTLHRLNFLHNIPSPVAASSLAHIECARPLRFCGINLQKAYPHQELCQVALLRIDASFGNVCRLQVIVDFCVDQRRRSKMRVEASQVGDALAAPRPLLTESHKFESNEQDLLCSVGNDWPAGRWHC